jgi:hypothetical protein
MPNEFLRTVGILNGKKSLFKSGYGKMSNDRTDLDAILGHLLEGSLVDGTQTQATNENLLSKLSDLVQQEKSLKDSLITKVQGFSLNDIASIVRNVAYGVGNNSILSGLESDKKLNLTPVQSFTMRVLKAQVSKYLENNKDKKDFYTKDQSEYLKNLSRSFAIGYAKRGDIESLKELFDKEFDVGDVLPDLMKVAKNKEVAGFIIEKSGVLVNSEEEKEVIKKEAIFVGFGFNALVLEADNKPAVLGGILKGDLPEIAESAKYGDLANLFNLAVAVENKQLQTEISGRLDAVLRAEFDKMVTHQEGIKITPDEQDKAFGRYKETLSFMGHDMGIASQNTADRKALLFGALKNASFQMSISPTANTANITSAALEASGAGKASEKDLEERKGKISETERKIEELQQREPKEREDKDSAIMGGLKSTLENLKVFDKKLLAEDGAFVARAVEDAKKSLAKKHTASPPPSPKNTQTVKRRVSMWEKLPFRRVSHTQDTQNSQQGDDKQESKREQDLTRRLLGVGGVGAIANIADHGRVGGSLSVVSEGEEPLFPVTEGRRQTLKPVNKAEVPKFPPKTVTSATQLQLQQQRGRSGPSGD